MIEKGFGFRMGNGKKKKNGYGPRYIGVDARFCGDVLDKENLKQTLAKLLRKHAVPMPLAEPHESVQVVRHLSPYVSRQINIGVLLRGGYQATFAGRVRTGDPGRINLTIVDCMIDANNPEWKPGLNIVEDRCRAADMTWEIRTPKKDGPQFSRHDFFLHSWAAREIFLHEAEECIGLFGDLKSPRPRLLEVRNRSRTGKPDDPYYMSGYISSAYGWWIPRMRRYGEVNGWKWKKLLAFDGDLELLKGDYYDGKLVPSFPDYTKPAPPLPDHFKVSKSNKLSL